MRLDRAELPIALNLPPLPDSVTEARQTLARLAAEVGADRDAVELAVAEAVGNAVLHAYPEGATGTVRIVARLDSGSLVVVVADDGVGMRPDPASRGLGFGLPLIAQLSSGLEISDRDGGGAELVMRFPAPAERTSEVGR
jgi:anti-sigma regulatory factor (Ser/Thr protein kinase)